MTDFDQVDEQMLLMNNPEVYSEHRQEAIKRLEQSLLVQHPSSNPAKITQAASRIEESVFGATFTRDEYERMINSRINHITNSAKKTLTNSSSSSSTSSLGESSSSTSSSTISVNAPLKSLSDEEKQFVIGKLAPLQVHLPKMEKLLLLFQQQQSLSKDPELTEYLRKYTALKGVLQKQLELFPLDSYIVTPTSASSLVEHVHKLTATLVLKAKGLLSTTNSNQKTTQPLQVKPILTNLSLTGELDDFEKPFLNGESIEQELKLLHPPPQFQKILFHRPDGMVIFLGWERLLIKFQLTPSRKKIIPGYELQYKIQRGQALISKCNHGIIGGKVNIRSIWRHLLHHYNKPT